MRDGNGVLTHRFGTTTALHIFENIEGKWKDLVDGSQVYVVTEDSSFTISKEIKIYIWEGSKIYKD
jgi:hypothetical protein